MTPTDEKDWRELSEDLIYGILKEQSISHITYARWLRMLIDARIKKALQDYSEKHGDK